MNAFVPTPEQVEARDAFTAQAATNGALVIEAGAGTGKTATLALLAESTGRHGQYMAFNKAIVSDSGGRFPDSVSCNTAHSLAFRAVGRTYKQRLDNGRRIRNEDIARALRIDPIDLPTGAGNERRRLAPGWLAGQVMRALERFCQTADESPSGEHVPYVDGLDLPTPDGHRGWANNRELRRYLAPFITAGWLDLCQTLGFLRFGHSHYLKLWQLSGPRIPADYILFDEAQDANPVMAAVVEIQDHAQRVYVGDGAQAIYEWTGAIDAMSRMAGRDGTVIAYLSQSFRFGSAIADVANTLLSKLGTPLRLRGLDAITSRVELDEPLDRPHAVLCRTNATAVRRVLTEQALGYRAALVGDGRDVLDFAEGAEQLQQAGHTGHRELSCFSSWASVQAYVAADPMGHELRLLVALVDEFGPQVIRQALGRLPREADAEIVVSTAHKAKGREWPTVALAGDFPVPRPDAEPGNTAAETRLLYVACTRARHVLDVSACPLLCETAGIAP